MVRGGGGGGGAAAAEESRGHTFSEPSLSLKTRSLPSSTMSSSLSAITNSRSTKIESSPMADQARAHLNSN